MYIFQQPYYFKTLFQIYQISTSWKLSKPYSTIKESSERTDAGPSFEISENKGLIYIRH